MSKRAGARKAKAKARGSDDPLENFFSAVKFGDVETVQNLLDEGVVDINAVDKENGGMTALFYAIDSDNEDILKFLLEHDIDSDHPNDAQQSPLFYAAMTGKEHALEIILEMTECDINAPGDDSKTPLIIAAEKGSERIVDLLLDFGGDDIDLDAVDLEGRTALHHAAKSGVPSLLKMMGQALGRKAFGIADAHGRLPIHHAILSGSLETVQMCLKLDKGEFADEPDDAGKTPLLLAAANNLGDVVTFLLQNDAVDPAAVDDQGNTVLHSACATGNLELVHAVLDSGALDVNEPNEEDQTPLHLAAQGGHEDICRVLIEESGADVHALTRDGYSPLAMAVARGHAELALTLIELHAGAVTDKVGPTKNTLLHLACESGNVLMLEVLLSSADVDPDPQNGEGVTPLQVAAGHGHLEAVKFLIDKGANVNRPDRHGLTTLAAAAYQGSVDLVHFLIDECGAKVDVLNDKGASPLHGACQKGHVEVARALVAAGADVNLRTKDGLCAVYLAAQANAPALVRFLADDCDADLTTATDLKVTPLHIAAWMGHTECARAIVELAGDRLGALLKAKDVNGLTPLHGAANQNHPECARMLVELGASACETTARGATPGDLAKDPDLQAFLKALEAEHKFEFEHKILFDELRGLAERLAAVEAAKGIAPPPEGKRKHRPQESLGGAAELPGMASADDLKKLQDAQKKLTALTTALQKETVDLREEIERLAVEQAPAPSGRGGKDKDKDLSDKAEKLRQLEDSIDEVLRRLADVEEVAATAAAAGKKGARADKAAGLTDEDRERLAHVDELVEVTRVLQEAHEELEGRVATLEAAPPPAAAATPVKGSRGAGDKGMEAVLERLTQLEAAAEESSAILPELEALDARVVELEALVAENAQLKESMEELQIKMMTLVPAQMEEVETRLLDAIDRKIRQHMSGAATTPQGGPKSGTAGMTRAALARVSATPTNASEDEEPAKPVGRTAPRATRAAAAAAAGPNGSSRGAGALNRDSTSSASQSLLDRLRSRSPARGAGERPMTPESDGRRSPRVEEIRSRVADRRATVDRIKGGR